MTKIIHKTKHTPKLQPKHLHSAAAWLQCSYGESRQDSSFCQALQIHSVLAAESPKLRSQKAS